MPKAMKYVCVSLDKQLDNMSIEKQREEFKRYWGNCQLTTVYFYSGIPKIPLKRETDIEMVTCQTKEEIVHA